MQPTSEPGQPGLKAKTFPCMGTVISLTVPAAPGDGPTAEEALAGATAAVERIFEDLDGRFSLYRPESEASRVARRELSLQRASQDFRARYAEATEWRILTEGSFTPERPDGVPDLSGLVKGFAIAEAGAALRSVGLEDWCLNAGGDVLVAGSPIPGSRASWQAGIVDPEDRRSLIAACPLGSATGRAALATSGSAERGDHIWTSGTGASEFRQVSVAAADIVTADVLATAVVAGGMPMLNRATDRWDVEVLAVRNDGGVLATAGFRG